MEINSSLNRLEEASRSTCSFNIAEAEMEKAHKLSWRKKCHDVAVSYAPIIGWLPNYSLQNGLADLLAGVTVGLLVVPQSIAYSSLAGLSSEYGLYSSLLGGLVYCLFGTTPYVTIGPVSVLALMTAEISEPGPDFVILLTFISGVIILFFGILKLGFILDFISTPVIAGFTSAASIKTTIIQIKPLLGISVANGQKSSLHLGIVDIIIEIVTNLSTIRYQDALLGVICVAFLLLFRVLGHARSFERMDKDGCGLLRLRLPWKPAAKTIVIADKIMWFLSRSRSALVVFFSVVISMLLSPNCLEARRQASENTTINGTLDAECTFTLTGEIEAGLPSIQPPRFNSTLDGASVGVIGMLTWLGSSIALIPLLAVLENIALAKAFAEGKWVDSSQEMISLGLCNLIGSFIGSMPVTASFSRTSLNHASGVKTPISGMITSLMVMFCLLFLMPYCAEIPQAALAAIILTAVIFTVELHILKPIWKVRKLDSVPMLSCFLACLFYDELALGIGVGVALQTMHLLYLAARPSITYHHTLVSGGLKRVLLVVPECSLLYPAASHFKQSVLKKVEELSDVTSIVVDCSKITCFDFTSASACKDLIEQLSSRSILIFWMAPAKDAAIALKNSSQKFRLIQKLEEINIDTH